ncbi:MAG: glycosyltransferase family 39 protein [Chloroflexi bacterium]|nr:glycosyltransferase family 39 protein [Chloroflexota bacterium]
MIRRSSRVWGTAVLLLMFALALTSMGQLSPTFDEQGFIVRGLGYMRGQNRHIRVGHPLGLNALNAALLAHDETVSLPISDPSWLETNFHRPAELFLWGIGNDVKHIMFLARLPTIWLGMLLAAVVGRWAWRMSGQQWAGLLALTLIALDPNILASARLATTDLGLTLGAAAAGFTLWLFLKRPSWKRAIIAGIGFGLLQNTKFTAGLFVPLFALVILVYCGLRIADLRLANEPVRRQSEIRNLKLSIIMLLIAYPLAAFITLWAAYGFQSGTLPLELPAFSQLTGLTIPLSHHVEQLLDIGGRLQVETPSFLLGQYSNNGWWYYFPVTFALKTSLPILILLTLAFALRIIYYVKNWSVVSSQRSAVLDDTALLIPALGYFAIALTSDINLGYRHLLPILPFTAVFIANTISDFGFRISELQFRIPHSIFRNMATVFMVMLLLVVLRIHPHYLSYFNVLAGGPDGGWRYLVDSNIDWGQDLNKLKGWMDENGVEEVWLSYFGESRPDYYGIEYWGLDSWPPRLMNPQARPYYPPDPAPGIYAISATNLQGVHFDNHDQYAWFREREPIAKVGYSIFLYDVPAHGELVDVVLAGMQLDEISPADFAHLDSNDIVPRWIDPALAALLPQSDNRWLLLAKDAAVSPPLAAQISISSKQTGTDDYAIYQMPPLTVLSDDPIIIFAAGEGEVGLMKAAVNIPLLSETEATVPGQDLLVNTSWQQNSSPQPVQIFIHLVDDNDNIVAQWDGLGTEWSGWQPGDVLQLTHTIPLPDDLPAAAYEIRAGLYHSENGRRWLTADGVDFVNLGTVIIGE